MELFSENNQTYFVDSKNSQVIFLTDENGKFVHEIDYQLSLNDLFGTVYNQNGLYRSALNKVEDRVLLHSIGQTDPMIMTLTQEEYVSRLNILRNSLKNQDEELDSLAYEFVNENQKLRRK